MTLSISPLFHLYNLKKCLKRFDQNKYKSICTYIDCDLHVHPTTNKNISIVNSVQKNDTKELIRTLNTYNNPTYFDYNKKNIPEIAVRHHISIKTNRDDLKDSIKDLLGYSNYHILSEEKNLLFIKDYKYNINVIILESIPIMLYAVIKFKHNIVNLLLERKYDPNIKTILTGNPISLSFDTVQFQLIDMWIENEINIHKIHTSCGNNLLIEAIRLNNSKCINYILKKYPHYSWKLFNNKYNSLDTAMIYNINYIYCDVSANSNIYNNDIAILLAKYMKSYLTKMFNEWNFIKAGSDVDDIIMDYVNINHFIKDSSTKVIYTF